MAVVRSLEEAMADGSVRDCSGEHGGGRGWRVRAERGMDRRRIRV
jgi:hypothetical protein